MASFTQNHFFKITLLGLIFAIPLIFYRGLLDSFDLTKATLLWILAPILILAVLNNLSSMWADRQLSVSTGLVLIAIAVSTVLSIRPGSSIFGQYQRYTGVLSWFSGILILVCTAVLSDRKFVQAVVNVTSVSVSISSGYVFLQASNLDPWDWVYGGQDKPLFGTMGNINTSAGFLGISVCLLIPHFLQLNSFGKRLLYGLPIFLASSAVGINESFQGNVAVLVGVLVGLVLLVIDTRRDFSFPFVALAIIAISTFAVRSSSEGFLSTIFGALVIISWSIAGRARGKSIFPVRSLSVRSRVTVVSLGVLVAAVTTSSLVLREIQSGMTERSAFYQSALSLWKERPIFGFGLETFGFLFSKHRPVWHAISYEANRPSSAHSVFLGLLVSGGIFLVGTFAFLLGLSLVRSAKRLREGSNTDYLRVSAFSMLLGAIAQSAVSVENVALLVLLLFVIGLNLGSWRHSSKTTSKKLSVSYLPMILATSMIPLVWIQAVRPMRADNYARQALVAVNVENSPSTARVKFESAIKTANWDPQQKVRYLSFMQEIGEVDQVLDLAVEATKQYMCLPSVALGTMFALAESGDFSRAIEMGECALDADPNSLVVRQQVQMVYEAMAEAALERGQVGIAKAFAELILAIDPDSSFAVSVSALEE